MLRRTSLVVALIAAIMVATSATKSASAFTPHRLPENPLEQAELIIALIRAHAPTAEVGEVMVAIASCETSGFAHTVFQRRGRDFKRNGQIVRAGQVIAERPGSGAFGVLQIMPAHIPIALRQHGLDIAGSVHDYIRYAYILREERLRRLSPRALLRPQSGFEDWNSSRACWASGGRTNTELQALRNEQTLLEIAEAR